jgi:allantoicase
MTPEQDLASRWLGASVLAASDESFGEKENLLSPEAAAFEAGHYGPRGEIVDGWETRRRREPGHDWALIRLGAPGTITTIDVDTSFFTGNHPQSCKIEACGCEGYPSPAELNDPATPWAELVPASPLHGDTHNIFRVSDPRRFTHVRLSIYPDGGVARLRVLGQVIPDPRGLEQLTIDLASQEYGGAVVASSDEFYTSACLLNRPDRARSMGEGWETRRRRDGGHDFVVFRLAFAGLVRQLIVDTAHFKYNASAAVTAYGCGSAEPPPAESAQGTGREESPLADSAQRSGREDVPPAEPSRWLPLLPRTGLQPDTRHVFPTTCGEPVATVRVDAFPDGGLSRVRVIGSLGPGARRAAAYRWLNSLPVGQAVRCLTDAGIGQEQANQIAGRRPLPTDWLDDLRFQPRPSWLEALGDQSLAGLVALLEGQPSS